MYSVKRPILFHSLAAIFLTLPSFSATRYVDLNAAGLNNGTSWANAHLNLQSALNAASPGDEILVAQGTYRPSVDETGNASPADPRTRTFFVNKNITLRGGFVVNGGVLEDRDIDSHRSVLSGDIGTPSNVTDNCYHTLLFENVSNACRLDGFYIQEGQANGVNPDHKKGPGAYLRATASQTSPEISNCRFKGNVGTGALYLDVYDNDDNTRVTNCLFTGNFGSFESAASALHSQIRGVTTQNLRLDNCIFTKNSGTGPVLRFVATAEFFAEATVLLNNCSVAGNVQPATVIIQPEAVSGATIQLTARNSIFYNPDAAATEILAAVPASDTTVDLDFCFLAEANCTAITQSGTVVNCGSDMFYNTDPQFASLSGGNLRPVTGSPLIDAGQAATGTSHDYRGAPRPAHNGYDIGAFEFPENTPQLTFRLTQEHHSVLTWSCLTGEKYTIRRATNDLTSFTTISTGYPSSGTTAWSEVFIDTSTGSTPRAYYQVVRE